MDKCNYDFVIMVKGKASFVSSMILEYQGSFETNRTCAIREYSSYGITIKSKLYADDEKERYFHLYHKVTRASAERTKLENKLRDMSEAMDKVKGKEIKKFR